MLHIMIFMGKPRAMMAVSVLVALSAASAVTPQSASATSYPSWEDVLAARGSATAKAAETERVQAALAQVEDRVRQARAAADRAGAAFLHTQQLADAAALRKQGLQEHAEEAATTADASGRQAGLLAASMARTAGGDVATHAVGAGEDARSFLYRLSTMGQLGQEAEQIRAQATTEAGVARSLEQQAARAQSEFDARRRDSEHAMRQAQDAADAAASAQAEQERNRARLQAQLATLRDGVRHTEAEYAAGVAAAEAARPAPPPVAAPAPPSRPAPPAPPAGGGGGGSGSGSGPSGGGGTNPPAPSGWVRPAGGTISSPYGWRKNPVTGAWALHEGTDLASGCSTAIVAATAGTVTYAGVYGGYGNYVRIDHGSGISTAYGHIVNGGIRVRSGQHVAAGQLIALVGSTGNSTGCHLHFETRIAMTPTDPVPFMAARGVQL